MGDFYCDADRLAYTTIAAAGVPFAVVYQSLMGMVFLTMDWQLQAAGFLYTPWRLYLQVSWLPAAVAYFVISNLPESPRFLLAKGRHYNALTILKALFSSNNGEPKGVSLFFIYF